MTNDQLTQLRELCEGAGCGDGNADYAFIAAARTAVPELLALVERLEGEVEGLKASVAQSAAARPTGSAASETPCQSEKES